jgi:transcription antitermination protein NusB
MLFQLDVAGGDPVEIYPHFWKEHEVEAEVKTFASELVEGVVQEREALDRIISGSAENWRIERMAVVDRNILRMAVFELARLPETPAAVVLDEAIEVGKKYGSENSGAFLNGILDAIRKRIERGEIPVSPPREV